MSIIYLVGGNYGITCHVNQLLAEDSHEISNLILFFENTFRIETYNKKELFDKSECSPIKPVLKK